MSSFVLGIFIGSALVGLAIYLYSLRGQNFKAEIFKTWLYLKHQVMKPVLYWQSTRPIQNDYAFIKCIRSSPYEGYMTVEIGKFNAFKIPEDYTRIVAIKVPKDWSKWNKERKEKYVLSRPESKIS